MLGKIFDLNQNSFVQQKKMLSHKPVSFILTLLDHFVSFIIFAQKHFPELKVADKIITYGTILILELKKLENVIAIFF